MMGVVQGDENDTFLNVGAGCLLIWNSLVGVGSFRECCQTHHPIEEFADVKKFEAVNIVLYAAVARFVREEEQWLAAQFGTQWAGYAGSVGRIFPRLW